MPIYANVPEKYFHSNRPFSNKLTNHKIIVGEIYALKTDKPTIIKKVNKGLIEYFYRETGLEPSEKTINDFTEKILKDYELDNFNTDDFIGEYIVINTSMSGGGYAQGTDYYNDGYKVVCRKIVNNEITDKEISFYQSGSFTAVILPEEISPIRHVELQYTTT